MSAKRSRATAGQAGALACLIIAFSMAYYLKASPERQDDLFNNLEAYDAPEDTELPDLKIVMFWKSLKQRQPNDITVTTHLSLSRLMALQAQCAVWPFTISAVVWVPQCGHVVYSEKAAWNETIIQTVESRIASFHKSAEITGSCRLDLVLVSEEMCQHMDSMDSPTSPMYADYPINALRNLAISEAATDVVLAVDVDQLPALPANFKDSLESYKKLVDIMSKQNAVVVLPSLQPVKQDESAWETALEAVYKGKSYVSSLLLDGYVRDHNPAKSMTGKTAPSIDLNAWADAETLYESTYRWGFAPFFLALRSTLPCYDERFRGYAANRKTHVHHLSTIGTKFMIHPEMYSMHLWHRASPAFTAFAKSRPVREQIAEVLSSIMEGLSAGSYWPITDNGCHAKPVLVPQITPEALQRSASQCKYRPSTLHAVHTWWADGGEDVKPRDNSITMMVQLSLSRLDRLRLQCTAWPGYIAAAVYAPVTKEGRIISPEASDYDGADLHVIQQEIDVFHREANALADSCKLSIQLVSEVFNNETEACFYPYNALRNRALSLIRTEAAFLMDVDFLPSQKVAKHWHTPAGYQELVSELSSGTALVLPAFQTKDNGQFGTVLALRAAYSTKKGLEDSYLQGVMFAFARDKYIPGHTPSRTEEWFNVNESYPLQYAWGYEPYIVTLRKFIPWYDERFRGYGMDKIIHICSLAGMGIKFRAHPQGFVVHVPHVESPVLECTENSDQWDTLIDLGFEKRTEIAQQRYSPESTFCGVSPHSIAYGRSDDENAAKFIAKIAACEDWDCIIAAHSLPRPHWQFSFPNVVLVDIPRLMLYTTINQLKESPEILDDDDEELEEEETISCHPLSDDHCAWWETAVHMEHGMNRWQFVQSKGSLMLVDQLKGVTTHPVDLLWLIKDMMPWAKVILLVQDTVSYTVEQFLQAEYYKTSNNLIQGSLLDEIEQFLNATSVNSTEQLAALLLRSISISSWQADRLPEILKQWFDNFPAAQLLVMQREGDPSAQRKQLQRFLDSDGLPRDLERLLKQPTDAGGWDMHRKDFKALGGIAADGVAKLAEVIQEYGHGSADEYMLSWRRYWSKSVHSHVAS